MVTIGTLIGGDITITTTPPISPSPYFVYDSNRVITGLYQGSPNVWDEGTYIDLYDGEEKPYSGWTYGGSNVVENYATAIRKFAFDDSSYFYESILPSKAITGNITFQNITSIGKDAFNACSGLTSMTIGSGLQGIGQAAFETYGNPITLTIGKTIAEVQAMGQTDYNQDTNVPYSDWNLPSGSTIICTNGTIPIEEY